MLCSMLLDHDQEQVFCYQTAFVVAAGNLILVLGDEFTDGKLVEGQSIKHYWPVYL